MSKPTRDGGSTGSGGAGGGPAGAGEFDATLLPVSEVPATRGPSTAPSPADATLAALSAAPDGATATAPPAVRSGKRGDYSELVAVDPQHYVVGAELARGGMGRILTARDRRLGRTVAIKELLVASGDLRARFEREARITAKLQHPAIVNILEAGTWPGGEPFYAMKLVSGESLDKVVAARTTLAERLALLPTVIAVVDALAFAHDRRVIHRDLKPANVLVGEFGETVVIDWGLAKDLSDPTDVAAPAAGPYRTAGAAPGATIAGSVMGTPAYMPVEQARGDALDERADVYALGALLYHVLAGVPPYRETSSEAVLDAVIAGPPPPLTAHVAGAPPDLVAIVSKAMAYDAAQRYPSAKQLADDLKRFQTGQLVGAHQYSAWQLVRRFVRRNRAPVVVAATLSAILAIGGIVAVRRIVAERDRAREAQQLALAAQGESELQRGRAETKEVEATRRADALTVLQARSMLDQDPTQSLAYLKTLGPTFASWPEARLVALSATAAGVARHVEKFDQLVSGVLLAPDGRTVAVTASDLNVYLIDVETGARRVLAGSMGKAIQIEWMPDGNALVTAGFENAIRVWDVATGTSRELTGHEGRVYALELSKDGRVLASSSADKTIRIWDVVGGTSRVVSTGLEGGFALALSRDGRWLASDEINKVRVWDLSAPDAAPRVIERPERLRGIGFSPDSRWITITTRGAPDVWLAEVATLKGRMLAGVPDPAGLGLYGAVFSPDGKTVVAAAGDGKVRVWDLATGAARAIVGHTGTISALRFLTADRLLSCGGDGMCQIADVATGAVGARLRGHQGPITGTSLSQDRSLFVTASQDRTMRIWRLPTLPWFAQGVGRMSAIRFTPDGQGAVVSGEFGALRWDLASGTRAPITAVPTSATTFSPDGGFMARGGDDNIVYLTDVRAGTERKLEGHTAAIWALAFSPDGKLLATCGQDNSVRVWDVAGNAPVRVFAGHTEITSDVMFAPDGRTLVSAGFDKKLRIWDLATGEARVVEIKTAAFSLDWAPDGKTIAVVGNDSAVMIWNVADGTWRELAGHANLVYGVMYSPDGTELVTAGQDGTVRLWDVATGASAVLRGQNNIQDVAFASDGRRVCSVSSEDKTARLWDVAAPRDEAALRTWLATQTSAAVDQRR